MVYLRNKNLLQPLHDISNAVIAAVQRLVVHKYMMLVDILMMVYIVAQNVVQAIVFVINQYLVIQKHQCMLLSCRMLVCFDLQITVNQAYRVLSLERDVVSRFYRRIREALLTYSLQLTLEKVYL